MTKILEELQQLFYEPTHLINKDFVATQSTQLTELRTANDRRKRAGTASFNSINCEELFAAYFPHQ